MVWPKSVLVSRPSARGGLEALREVVVWRNQVLPPSETFIANQAASYRRWKPVFAGLDAVPNAWDIVPAISFAGTTPQSVAQRTMLTRAGVSPRLRRFLARPAVGIVHAHFGLDATDVLGPVRRAGKPLVVTFHGYDVTLDRSLLPSRMLRRWRPLLDYASELIAVSDFIADQLLTLGAPPHKIQVLPIGIPVPPCPDSPRSRPPRILFVGRLVEKKGCADLLTAVRLLPEPHRQVPVLVVGDGPLRDELEQEAQGLNVTFAGSLPPSGVRHAMATSTLFCAPSKTARNGDREGFGMVFLEASAAQLPVLTYASGGTPEAVADDVSGLLVPEGDVRALSRALLRLLGDPELAVQLGTSGRDRVELAFAVEARTAVLEDLYDEVTGRAGLRP